MGLICLRCECIFFFNSDIILLFSLLPDKLELQLCLEDPIILDTDLVSVINILLFWLHSVFILVCWGAVLLSINSLSISFIDTFSLHYPFNSYFIDSFSFLIYFRNFFSYFNCSSRLSIIVWYFFMIYSTVFSYFLTVCFYFYSSSLSTASWYYPLILLCWIWAF